MHRLTLLLLCALFWLTWTPAQVQAAASVKPSQTTTKPPTAKATQPSTPKGKPAPKKPAAKQAKTPAKQSKPSPAALDAELSTAIKDYEALLKNVKRAQKREHWQALEKRFQTLAEKKQGENRILASWHAAKVRQSLGIRSASPYDQNQAAEMYAAFAAKYPNHSLAPEALYQQAHLLGVRQKNAALAIPILEALAQKYPRYQELAKAKKLLAQLSGSQTSTTKKTSPSPSGKKEAAPPSTGNAPNTLKSIKWTGNGRGGTLLLEMTKPVDYQYAFVSGKRGTSASARLSITLPQTAKAPSLKETLTFDNCPLPKVVSSKQGNDLRVVCDTSNLKSYSFSTSKQSPHLLEVKVSTGPAPTPVTLPRLHRPQLTLAEQLGLSVQTIMIDAGHGGKDPGAAGNNIAEAQFTLNMAKKVGKLLKKHGFTVLYTRDKNSYLSLQARPDLANSKKADLFISIHVNANADTSINGLETYYLDAAKSHSAEKVAARENSVTIKNMSDLQFILSDFMLSSKLEESKDLAACVHSGILNTLGKHKFKMNNNGVRSAPFHVLMGAKMPAILIEFGYLSNVEEAKRLKDEKFLQAQAEGLVAGIIAYKEKLARYAPKQRAKP